VPHRQDALVKPSKRQLRSEFPVDSLWRDAVMDAGSWVCAARDRDENCDGSLQADHMQPRSQGGLSNTGNGLILCRHHHDEKTASRLQIDPEWLRPDQYAYLRDSGWCWWVGGQPVGKGWKHFLPMLGA